MIKLSELPNDAMLTVGGSDFRIMDKSDFLESAYFLDYGIGPCPTVTLAEKTVQTFDLDWIIELIGDGEVYEGWGDDVIRDIYSMPETAAFLGKVKEVFERHPTYWEGEPVCVDMQPPGVTDGQN